MMNKHRVWAGVVVIVAALGGAAYAINNGDEGTPKNGLSHRSFLRNPITTNQASVRHLVTSKLNNDIFTDPDFALQLHHPHGRAVMTELVKCALAHGSQLTWIDPLTQNSYRFDGEVGLCQSADATIGDWTAAPPSPACQQLVTACIAARVNAVGEAIPLSLRGRPLSIFATSLAVKQETHFREQANPLVPIDPAVGQSIGSYTWPFCLEAHECGWMPANVGKCQPNEIVKIAITDPARCAMPLRVCGGLHGCMTQRSGWTWPPDFGDRLYSGFLMQRSTACPAAPVQFNCNALAAVGGYYSVMVDPPFANHSVPPIANLLTTSSYPATEQQTFQFREGAFYGNLFEPDSLRRNCYVTAEGPDFMRCAVLDTTPIPTACAAKHIYEFSDELCRDPEESVPYRHVYACFSAPQNESDTDDGTGIQYLNARICDLKDNDERCFPHVPRRCFYNDPATNDQRGAHCERLDGVYQNCRGLDANGTPADASTLYRPITTYLNTPCDAIEDDTDLCSTITHKVNGGGIAAEHAAAVASPELDEAPEVTGGCSAAGGGGLAVALLLLSARAFGASRRACSARARRATTP